MIGLIVQAACSIVQRQACMRHGSCSERRPAHALQILAPLTKGGNLPFRRLCADFGAEATMSEMSFARHLLRGAPQEKALLKRAANEACFWCAFTCLLPGSAITHRCWVLPERPPSTSPCGCMHCKAAEVSAFAGFQFATNNIGEGVAAAKLAAESGASWVDLNCGCPIHGPRLSLPLARMLAAVVHCHFYGLDVL